MRSSVEFFTKGNAGIVNLNRPKALNALNHEMVKLMRPQLDKWKKEEFPLIIIKGEGGKAFCAGGDIKDLTLPTYHGDYSGTNFFRELYQLDYALATYPKPFVAFMHGVVMGGGVGLSVHTPIRIGTEKTLFAMPETGIGLFPDVGAGYFLPRIKQKGLGMYLGLTGERLKGGNSKHAGVVTHFVDSKNLIQLEQELVNLPEGITTDEINNFVKKFESDVDEFALQSQLADIETYRKFHGKSTIFELIQDLEGSESEWAAKVAKKIRKMSPISVAITFGQISNGANMSIEEVFEMEYRLAYSCIRHEFPEGVRAVLIDRDNSPKWNPSKLEDVTPDMIDSFFQEKPNPWHPTESFTTLGILQHPKDPSNPFQRYKCHLCGAASCFWNCRLPKKSK